MRKVLVLILCVSCVHCASNFELIKSPVNNLSLQINVPQYETLQVREHYQDIVDEIINEYNGPMNINNSGESENHLNINIKETKIAGSKQRFMALGITTIGLALPVYLIANESPFWIGFYMLPTNNTQVTFDLSNNLEVKDKELNRKISTLSFYGNESAQIEKQKVKIKNEIKSIIKNIETHNLNCGI